jgi:hypothetical protein
MQALDRGPLHAADDRPRNRVHRHAAQGSTLLPHAPPQGTAPKLGARRGNRGEASPRSTIPSRRRCSTTTPPGRRPARQRADDRPRPHNHDLKLTPPAGLVAEGRKVAEGQADGGRGGRPPLTGPNSSAGNIDASCRTTWPACRASTTGWAGVLDHLDAEGLADEHDRDLHHRQRLVPGRPRPLRQAVHVRAWPAGAAARPGARGSRQGATPEQFVANIDLAPTILDLAGVPVPAVDAGPEPGLPLLRGERSGRLANEVSTTATTTTPATTTRGPTRGVRTATHKLIHYWKQDAWELFDLVADPAEQHNLLFDADEARGPRPRRTRGRDRPAPGGDDGRCSPTAGSTGGSRSAERRWPRQSTASGVVGRQAEDDVEPRRQLADP